MNRQRRRTLQSSPKLKDLRGYLEVFSSIGKASDLVDGDKVRLNTDRIMANNFEKKSSRYKQFVQDNSSKVFTVEYDRDLMEDVPLYCLKEDPSEIKWLWVADDLIKLPSEVTK